MKNVLNTTKKKIIAGATAVTIVSGGFVFANSDLGDQLRAWFAGEKEQAVNQVGGDVYQYGYGKAQDAINFADKKSKDGLDKVNAEGDKLYDKGKNDINNHKQNALNSLDGAKSEILSSVESEFDALKTELLGQIDTIEKQGYQYINDRIANKLNGSGKAKADEVSSKLDQVTQNAKSELEKAIADAKAEIKTKIAQETNATIDELKAEIDARIAVLKDHIVQLTADLTNEQINIIAAAVDASVADAKSQLDAVVANVN